MFSRLDTNFDLQLDQSEIKSLYLDRNEPCSDVFFKSCDVHADKAITSSEWCTCFQRYTGMVSPFTHMQIQALKMRDSSDFIPQNDLLIIVLSYNKKEKREHTGFKQDPKLAKSYLEKKTKGNILIFCSHHSF